MNDLVKRLRDRARFDSDIDPYKLLVEAADEIERLQNPAPQTQMTGV